MKKLSDLPRTDRPLNWAIYRDGPDPDPGTIVEPLLEPLASKSINGCEVIWGAGPAASFLQRG